jgi:hypothetical protein
MSFSAIMLWVTSQRVFVVISLQTQSGNFWIYPRIPSKYSLLPLFYKSRDSSVGIALGYGLNDRGSRVPFPEGAENFSLHHRVQNGAGAHPVSYPLATRGFFPGVKAAGS